MSDRKKLTEQSNPVLTSKREAALHALVRALARQAAREYGSETLAQSTTLENEDSSDARKK